MNNHRERLRSLGDSKSYMFLGRNNRESIPKNIRASSITTGTKQNVSLMRDDFLIWELTFHSDAPDGNIRNRKTKITDTSEYSVVYHNWTLRHLYKHVVSSIKFHNNTSPSVTAAAAATAVAATVGGAHRRRRSQSDVSSVPSFPSPPPTPLSRHHRVASVGTRSTNPHPYQPKLLGSNLHPRDMRRLVTPFSASNEPELIVRRHVIVFNFDPLRTIITRDRLLVLVPNGADSILKNLEERIVGSCLEYNDYNEYNNEDADVDNSNNENWNSEKHPKTANNNLEDVEEGVPMDDKGYIKTNGSGFSQEEDAKSVDDDDEWSEMMMMEMEGDQNDLTFELLCVNACLSTVFEMLADDTRELQDKGLQCIQERVIGGRGKKQPLKPEDALAVIRNLKNAVKVMQARVNGFVHSINRILNEDEDMALMNLSRLISHPGNFVQPISQEMLEIESDEPELVLESNLHNALTLSNALDLIEGQVDTARQVNLLNVVVRVFLPIDLYDLCGF